MEEASKDKDTVVLPSKNYSLHTDQDEVTISGYLLKKTREGRWQKRWFETNGVYLTYYKSKKMEKLLAALSLPQVGEIKTVPADQDPDGLPGLFSIELHSRVYTLRAKTDEEGEVWATTLNKLRTSGLSAQETVRHSDLPRATLDIEKDGKGGVSQDASVVSNSDWMKSGKKCCGCFGL